jgi:DNA-binding MarR family transcriptional regulator
VLVQITPTGRDIVDRALPDHLASERRLLSSLTPDERDTLAALLKKVLAGLEQADPQPAAVKRSRRRP